jgi:hypothetical protein
VYQAEQERDVVPLHRSEIEQILRCHVSDTERDQRLRQARGKDNNVECRQRQRDAVGDRE